jgi:hypothetical protein
MTSRRDLIRARAAALKVAPVAPRAVSVPPGRGCRCGCDRPLPSGYLSTYLPGHRTPAPSSAAKPAARGARPHLCFCGCGAEIPAGVRYRYMPGHRQ